MEEIKIYYWSNEKQRKGKELHSENSSIKNKVFKTEKNNHRWPIRLRIKVN